MKKGCFITGIVVFTILLGAALYIFQNHFDSLVLNPGKKLLAGFIKNELEEKLLAVADSPEKAELQKLIDKLSKDTEALKKIKEKDIDGLIKTIESTIEDSIIKKSELEEIKLIIKSKEK
jgi:hypothetical protein